jgi:hypothetical protein
MDEAWIQQSLARLESLEAYKAQVQQSGHAVDLSEVDAEIAALYEVLESAAGESEPQQQQPASPFAAATSPFEQPAYAPPMSPAMQAPAPVMAPTYDAGMSYADIDVDPPKSKAPFIAIGALLVAGLGAGGWFVAGQDGQEAAPQTQAVGDPQVINAGSIPEDTQEPKVAKGGEADRTEGTKIRESHRSSPRAHHDRRGPAPRADDRPKKTDKGDRKVGTIDNSRDPLAGAK